MAWQPKHNAGTDSMKMYAVNWVHGITDDVIVRPRHAESPQLEME